MATKVVDNQWLSNQTGAGEVVYPPGGRLGSRIQHAYQLVLLHSGWLRLTLDGTTTVHHAGNVILLLSGLTVCFDFASDSPTRHSWLTLHPDIVSINLAQDLQNLPRSIPLSRRMYLLVKDALHWATTDEAKTVIPLICQLGFSTYLAEFRYSQVESTALPEAIGVVERFIRFHYQENLSLADLATVASVTPEYLCRLFKKCVSRGPMTVLWEFRTERALDLLCTTGLSVAVVAERCGFKSPYHLHQRVKSLSGLSPTEYRQRL